MQTKQLFFVNKMVVNNVIAIIFILYEGTQD